MGLTGKEERDGDRGKEKGMEGSVLGILPP